MGSEASRPTARSIIELTITTDFADQLRAVPLAQVESDVRRPEWRMWSDEGNNGMPWNETVATVIATWR